MSGRDEESLHESCCLPPLINILLDSFNIFLRNFKIFLFIFSLTTLPLSLLLFFLSLSSQPLQSQIQHLEIVAHSAPTRFEARHVLKESRTAALSLLRIKVLFFVPSYALSLLAAITAFNCTALAWHGKRPSFSTAFKAVNVTWKRPLVTSIYVYGMMLTYAAVLQTLAAALISWAVPRLLVAIVGAVLEIELMAILSMGLVVSVEEERFGLDAIRTGWGLMEGRLVYGWVLSGLIVLGSGCIGWEMEGIMGGQDMLGRWYYSLKATVMMRVMGFGDKVGMVCLLGLVVLWSYIVAAVFYCECRKRHAIRVESEMTTV